MALSGSGPAEKAAKAWALLAAQQFEQAAVLYFELARQFPQDSGYAFNAGAAMVKMGRINEASACFRAAIRADPKSAASYFYLGLCLEQTGDIDGMLSSLLQYVQLNGDDVRALDRIGRALLQRGDAKWALPYLQRVTELNPTQAEPHADLGFALYLQGRFAEGIEPSNKAIQLSPQLAEAHWNKALCLLLLGRYEEGWREFEWRRRVPHLAPKQPMIKQEWTGEKLAGKTILLRAEGGHGDAIFFARYLPRVADLCENVHVECHPALISLFSTLKGVSRVIARGKSPGEHDCEAYLNSMPLIFGTTVSNIDATVPYLFPSQNLMDLWRERCRGFDGLRVGLCWAGSDQGRVENRSRSIDVFAPFANISDVTWFSLQNAPEGNQPRPQGLKVLDFMGDVHDFEQLGALIANLDLVISVDTGVAHLAGALGKTVWTLLPILPDFRWMVDREDSPWYPTMRLFRQTVAGSWREPVAKITQAVAGMSSRK